ncbi:MAG TPA: phosphate ABC transporter, permease protein PstA, partial [Nocardioides sp.]|nr:phosphate ABC transporter, permease protein PstA [Nocardioides sp.]
MTELTAVQTASTGLTSARLPRLGPALLAVGAIAIAGILLITGTNIAVAAIVAAVVFVAGLYAWSRVVE